MNKLDILVDGQIFNSNNDVLKLLWKDIKNNNLNLNPYEEIEFLQSLPNKIDSNGSFIFDDKYQAWRDVRKIV